MGERATHAPRGRWVVGGDEPVVEGLEADSCLGRLALGEVMPVQADLGRVGKVGPELEEERPEVVIDGVEVEVVHQGRGRHDPRVALARLGVDPLLGAEDVRLLLSTPDEQDTLAAVAR